MHMFIQKVAVQMAQNFKSFLAQIAAKSIFVDPLPDFFFVVDISNVDL